MVMDEGPIKIEINSHLVFSPTPRDTMSQAVYEGRILELKEKINDGEEDIKVLYEHLRAAEKEEYDYHIEVQTSYSAGAGAEARDPTFVKRDEGTKLVWVSNKSNLDYREAIVMSNWKIIQTNSVTNGYVDCHTDECGCAACWMYAHDPAEKKPRKVSFFDDEYAWRQTLDMENGKITVIPRPMTDSLLKELCMEPLKATTDALKLKELEERFPGATMVLSTDKEQLEIEYMGDGSKQHRIYSKTTNEIRKEFSDFGTRDEKPNLMAEWRGLYIGLEHLF